MATATWIAAATGPALHAPKHDSPDLRPIESLEPELLQLCDRGPGVVRLQAALGQAGFYSGSLTGSFDLATQAAVEKLQRLAGLTVSGTFDGATWYALVFWSWD